MPKYKQNEMLPMPHGGKRENSGRKKLEEGAKKAESVTIRIDKRLLEIIERLKMEMKEENTKKIKKIMEILNEQN